MCPAGIVWVCDDGTVVVTGADEGGDRVLSVSPAPTLATAIRVDAGASLAVAALVPGLGIWLSDDGATAAVPGAPRPVVVVRSGRAAAMVRVPWDDDAARLCWREERPPGLEGGGLASWRLQAAATDAPPTDTCAAVSHAGALRWSDGSDPSAVGCAPSAHGPVDAGSWPADVLDAKLALEAELAALAAEEEEEAALEAAVRATEATVDARTLLAAAASGAHAASGLPAPSARFRPSPVPCGGGGGPAVLLRLSVPSRLLAADPASWLLLLEWRGGSGAHRSLAQSLPLSAVMGPRPEQRGHATTASAVLAVPAEETGAWAGQGCFTAVTVAAWLVHCPADAALPLALPEGVRIGSALVDALWFCGSADRDTPQLQPALPALLVGDGCVGGSGSLRFDDGPAALSADVSASGFQLRAESPRAWGQAVTAPSGGDLAVPWWLQSCPGRSDPSGGGGGGEWPIGPVSPGPVELTLPGGAVSVVASAAWEESGDAWTLDLTMMPGRAPDAGSYARALLSLLAAVMARVEASEARVCLVRDGAGTAQISGEAIAAAGMGRASRELESPSWDSRLRACIAASGARPLRATKRG